MENLKIIKNKYISGKIKKEYKQLLENSKSLDETPKVNWSKIGSNFS